MISFRKFLLVFCLPSLGYASTFEATLYQQDSGKKIVLYHQKGKTEVKKGVTTATSVYTHADAPKKIAVKEKIIWNKKGFQKYIVEHKQLQESWITDRFGKKVQFKLIDHKTGKVKTDSEEMEPNFVVGPMIIPHLKKNWSRLVKGETIKVRFGVPARLETIGFKFFKDKELSLAGEKAILVKMKPTNFIIALLVDPIKIYFRKKDQLLMQIEGRTIPRQKDGGELDAETVFRY